ncbi:MAG TPA: Hsp20/alpha crystallin family protein [Bryobacteraceae bacterium]|nr:Hsp20/alpha crystallin family protein [Bryobacteraceae bacterium]
MPETKPAQTPSATERSVSRRPDDTPWRDYFGFGPYASFGPFGLMRRISEEMDRAFANAFDPSTGGEMRQVWRPAIEVRERDGNLEIDAELPGMTKDDVKVECTEEGIVIEGERRQEHEQTRGGFHRSERSYGRFRRMIPVPQGAEVDKAKAEFKDGVLRVRVPIPENKQKRRQIPIGS